jgi:hypothetical protein
MPQKFLVFSIDVNCFHEFSRVFLDSLSFGGVTNQQKPTKNQQKQKQVVNLLFKTHIDCFC